MKYVFISINLLMLTLTAHLTVQTIYDRTITPMVSSSNQPSMASVQNNPTKKTVKKKSISQGKKLITARNLFNVQVNETIPRATRVTAQSQSIGKIKQTKLKLALKGIIRNGSQVWAVIEDKKKRKQSLYKAGDKIGPATLQSVHSDFVILVQNGIESRLDLSVESVSFTGTKKRRAKKLSSSARANLKNSMHKPVVEERDDL